MPFYIEIAEEMLKHARKLERQRDELLEALEVQHDAEQWILENDESDPLFEETARLKLNHAKDLRVAAITKATNQP